MSKAEELLMKLFALVMLMVVMGAVLFVEGCSDDDEGTNPVVTPKTPLAYVYSSDSTGGVEARNLLQGYDFTVRLVPIGQVGSEDFAGDSLILVDNNTEDGWNNPDDVAAVMNSGKPVIAMGEGGYDLYGGFGLDIGSPNGAHDVRAVAKATVACTSLVTTPHAVAVPIDSMLELYTSDCQVVDIFESPVTVTIFAYFADDDRYAELVEQQDLFFLWGFGGPVSQMTTMGSNLFINTITYMLDK